MAETTELATLEAPASEKQQDVTITVTQETLERLRERTSVAVVGLAGTQVVDGKVTVTDAAAMVADKDGLKLVKTARMEAVKHRTRCAAEHKAIKEDALRECQRIDKSRRDLLAIIEEIEAPLIALEEAYEKELDRLAAEKETKLFQERRSVLVEAGAEPHHLDETQIRRMDVDAFQKHVQFVIAEKERKEAAEAERLRVEAEHRLERERLAEEARKLVEMQKVEAERLEKLHAELEVQRQEQLKIQQAQEAKLAAERAENARLKKIEDDKLAADRAELENLRKAQIDAANAVKAAEDARIARENEAIAEKQREFDRQAAIQREEQERIESEKLALDHEREMAETRKAADKMRQDADEVLKPYGELSFPKEPLEWHMAAAVEILDFMAACGYLVTADEIDRVAAIVCRHDPEMDW